MHYAGHADGPTFGVRTLTAAQAEALDGFAKAGVGDPTGAESMPVMRPWASRIAVPALGAGFPEHGRILTGRHDKCLDPCFNKRYRKPEREGKSTSAREAK